MKLNSIAQKHEVSMEELLQAENQFLQDQIEIQELQHSAELLETVIDCIKKENTVSPSIETMFGENWTSSNTALEELEQSLEGVLKTILSKAAEAGKNAMAERALASLKEKIKKIKAADHSKFEFPFKVPGSLGGRAKEIEQFYGLITTLHKCESLNEAKEKVNELQERIHSTNESFSGNVTVKNNFDLKTQIEYAEAIISNSDWQDKYQFSEMKKHIAKLAGSEDSPIVKLFERVWMLGVHTCIYNASRIVNAIYKQTLSDGTSIDGKTIDTDKFLGK